MPQRRETLGIDVMLGAIVGLFGSLTIFVVEPLWDRVIGPSGNDDDVFGFLRFTLGPGVVFGTAMALRFLSKGREGSYLSSIFILSAPLTYAFAIYTALALIEPGADVSTAELMLLGAIGGAIGGGLLLLGAGLILEVQASRVLLAITGTSSFGLIGMLAWQASASADMGELFSWIVLHGIWQGAFFGLYGALMR